MRYYLTPMRITLLKIQEINNYLQLYDANFIHSLMEGIKIEVKNQHETMTLSMIMNFLCFSYHDLDFLILLII